MRTRTQRISGLLAAATVLLSSSVANADARTEARRHFRRGMELVVEGQIDAGVAELEEAYNILPHPNVLYNIGRAYAEVGRYEDAREFFDRYLESDPPDREEVRAIVAAIDQRIEARAVLAATPTTTTTTQTTTGTESTGETSTGTSGTGAVATEAEIAELRATATQLRAIAQLSGSEAMATRATELDALATSMEEARAAAEAAATAAATATAATTSTGEQTTTGTGATTSGEAINVAGNAPGTTYEEEVVSSSRFAQSPLDAASATTIITRQDIHLTGITNFPELLRRVAGVHLMSMTPADTNVAIRGFNRTIAPRVVVLVNGRSTYVDALGTNFWLAMAVDVEDVERIEILRGPASALYGANAFSGIVNIITRAPGDEPGAFVTFGAGNGNAIRAHVSTNGRSGDFSYRLSSGYSQFDRWTMYFDPDERVDLAHPVPNPERAFQEVHARADLRYRIGQNARLSFEGGYSQSGQINLWANAGFTDSYSSGPTSYAMANLQTNWGSIRGFWNRYDYHITQADQHLPGMDMTGNTVDVEAVFAREFDLGVPHNLHAGLGYRWKSIDWDILAGYRTQSHYSAFFEDTLRVSDVVRVTAGFRLDRHPLIDNVIWSPRAALVLRPTDGQSIRMSGTSSFRTMSFAETYVQFGLPTLAAAAVGGVGLGSEIALDNPSIHTPALRPERIITAELGYLNQESDSFDVEVSLYYNRVFDIMGIGSAGGNFTLADYADPNLASLASFDRETDRFGAATSLLSNPPDKYNVYGGEFAVRAYPVQGLDLYANYSLNYNFIVDSELGNDRDVRQPSHMLNAGVQYRSPFGLDVAADFHLYAKTLWPEVVFTPTGLDLQNIPLPAYYLINARVGMRLLGDRLELGVAAYNLTGNAIKQHPYGQTVPLRVMGSISARF